MQPSPRVLNASSLSQETTDPSQQDDAPSPAIPFDNDLQRDAYLIFRALCRLSTKTLPENADPK